MSLDLVLPDFALAADEVLEKRLPSLDGRWSRQTKALLQDLGATRLELNASWAATPIDWSCPVCGRRKPQIARLTPAGVLLCQLDIHHDHLGDEGARILWSAQAAQTDRARKAAVASAVQACRGLAERFHPTLVCNDCNAADGKAKTALNALIHPHFSFAPSEIAQFIRVEAHRPHEVDLDVAAAVWVGVADDVTDRLAFMELMARRIADGRHAREGSPYRAPPLVTAMNDLLVTGGLPWRGHALLSEIQARSIKRDGFGSSTRKAGKKPAVVPTLEDLQSFSLSVSPSDFWRAPAEDWRCEACARSRFEMLRKSPKSGLWTAGAHRRRVFIIETRPDALWRRNGWYEGELTYGDHETVWICKDCRQIITDTKQTGEHLSDDCLSLQDLRALLISVRPHERPEYDRKAAAQRAAENAEMMAAVEDFDDHRRLCLNLFYDRRQISRGKQEAEVDRFAAIVRADHVGADQRHDHLAWLLAEGRRFAEANARDRWPPNAGDSH